MAEPVLCLRHKEQPQQWLCFPLVQNPQVLSQVTQIQKSGISTEKLQLPLSPFSCSASAAPAAPKKDTNTSRDVKNLLYAGVHSMAKSTYRLMPCMEPRWTHTKLELIPSSRVFPLLSIILHSEWIYIKKNNNNHHKPIFASTNKPSTDNVKFI